jgi:hypothetical protein
MSGKLDLEDDNEAPPYERSTTPPPAFSDSKDTPRTSLHAQLTETRTRRIQHLLTCHIEPVLYSQFLDGIYKRAFIIIPADILTKQQHLAADDIVSLPNAGNVTVIRLSGDDHRAAFWQQPGVLQELASSLRARLTASGHKVESPTNIATESAQPSPSLEPSQQRTSSSWLKKQFGTPDPYYDPTATTNYKLGWRSENEDVPQRKLALDEVRVVAKVRDVSFRVETEMGLLDSVTGKVLGLELEVGT